MNDDNYRINPDPELEALVLRVWDQMNTWLREQGWCESLDCIADASEALDGYYVGTYDQPLPHYYVKALATIDGMAGLDEPTTFGLFHGDVDRLAHIAYQADVDSDHASGPLPAVLLRQARFFYVATAPWSEAVAVCAAYTAFRWVFRYRRITDAGFQYKR